MMTTSYLRKQALLKIHGIQMLFKLADLTGGNHGPKTLQWHQTVALPVLSSDASIAKANGDPANHSLPVLFVSPVTALLLSP
jgi:hypothetical protein